ncbi:MAG: hypothetical protein J6Z38_05100 [Lachnospiraceae bacterium]|nr:hypothetical protein [Lachnospiraceae bacterium]
MKKNEVTRIFVPAALLGLAAIVLCILLSGCFLYGPTSKKLTTYYTQSKVVSARFFTGARNGSTSCSELDAGRVQELVAKLDSMELKTKMAHTDYFWAGQYGIELTYEDGTFLVYDGTKLFQRKVPVTEGFASEDHLHSEFVEVTNMKFWEEMKAFFPEAAQYS